MKKLVVDLWGLNSNGTTIEFSNACRGWIKSSVAGIA